MNSSYLDSKVREALVAARGSKSGAQALLMRWAAQDELLLRAMAQPFLKAIAGAAIATAGKRGVSVAPQPGNAAAAQGRGRTAPAPLSPAPLSKDALARILDRVGRNDDPAPGSAPAAAPAKPGSPPGAKPSPPPGQANALKTLAAAYVKNRRG